MTPNFIFLAAIRGLKEFEFKLARQSTVNIVDCLSTNRCNCVFKYCLHNSFGYRNKGMLNHLKIIIPRKNSKSAFTHS
jgi:hypothetical protein